jgi:hypothetical protein
VNARPTISSRPQPAAGDVLLLDFPGFLFSVSAKSDIAHFQDVKIEVVSGYCSRTGVFWRQ